MFMFLYFKSKLLHKAHIFQPPPLVKHYNYNPLVKHYKSMCTIITSNSITSSQSSQHRIKFNHNTVITSNSIKSFAWLIHDIILIIIMYYIAINYLNSTYVPFITLRIALWFLWWYIQGAFFICLSVIAHECGHHGFSPNELLNTIL